MMIYVTNANMLAYFIHYHAFSSHMTYFQGFDWFGWAYQLVSVLGTAIKTFAIESNVFASISFLAHGQDSKWEIMWHWFLDNLLFVQIVFVCFQQGHGLSSRHCPLFSGKSFVLLLKSYISSFEVNLKGQNNDLNWKDCV